MEIQMRNTLTALVGPIERMVTVATAARNFNQVGTLRWGVKVITIAFHQNDSLEEALHEIVGILGKAQGNRHYDASKLNEMLDCARYRLKVSSLVSV